MEAESVYATTCLSHPGAKHVVDRTHPWYVGGRLEGVQAPLHDDFRSLRLTPAEVRSEFARLGWQRVAAFQARNPMNRAHFGLTLRAAQEAGAKLLLHRSVGLTTPGDVEYYVRVRCYRALLSRYPSDTARLALLPLTMHHRAKPSGTPSSARTAVARISLWGGTTRVRGPTRTANPFTASTPRRSCCGRTRLSWALQWCLSGP